jgi:glycosyltransferase involved in cell wall biosynthesis
VPKPFDESSRDKMDWAHRLESAIWRRVWQSEFSFTGTENKNSTRINRIRIVSFVFGTSPSAFVRGFLRAERALSKGYDWKTIQLCPKLKPSRGGRIWILATKIINHLSSRHFFMLFILLRNFRLVRRATMIYIVKSPPILLLELLKHHPAIKILDVDDPIWLPEFGMLDYLRTVLPFIDGLTCDNEAQILEIRELGLSHRAIAIPGEVHRNRPEDVPDTNLRRPERIGQLRMIWLGSRSTFFYLETVGGVLREILTNLKNVELVMLGPSMSQAERLGLPLNQITVVPDYGASEMEYYLGISDIGLFPLDEGSELSSLRGHLKPSIYKVWGLAVVASKVPYIENIVKHGVDGLICSSFEEWKSALELCALSEDFVERLKAEATKNGRHLEKLIDSSVNRVVLFVEELQRANALNANDQPHS